MKIGFVGLGQMGKPMAMNLFKRGGDLIVSARREESLQDFVARGIPATLECREVSRAALIFLCLPGNQALNEVLFGEKGLSHHLRPGQIVVDFSTAAYGFTLEIAKKLEALKVDFLDAPVSGMEDRAKKGTLTVMCGGRKEVFTTVRPYLEWIGNKIFYMGDTGSGQLTKLINQLLFNINIAALAEILPLAAKMGLDAEKVGEIVNSGTGRSFASEFFVPRILKGHFSDGYAMKNAYKDLISAAEFSAAQGIPLPVLHASTTTYQMALLRGYGHQDKGAMIRVFEELLGVTFGPRGQEPR